MITPLEKLARKLEKFSTLHPADRAAITALPCHVRQYEAHRYLVREGDRPTHATFLLKGFVMRHKIVANGGRQICSIHMAGDIIDMQNSMLEDADHNVQALTDVEVASVPVAALKTLSLDHPRVSVALLRDAIVDGSIAREWIANVGRRTARERLIHLLCEFALRLESAGLGDRFSYVLPMTQEHLADCTGLTPVHVNRTLRSIDKDGVITRDARSVTIHHWGRLAKMGDFRSGYLHLNGWEMPGPGLAAIA